MLLKLHADNRCFVRNTKTKIDMGTHETARNFNECVINFDHLYFINRQIVAFLLLHSINVSENNICKLSLHSIFLAKILDRQINKAHQIVNEQNFMRCVLCITFRSLNVVRIFSRSTCVNAAFLLRLLESSASS